MRLTTVLPAAILVLFTAGLCPAAGTDGGDVVVVTAPIGNDLYVAGGKVVLTEPTAGDVVAAGGSMVVSGAVGEDLQIVGGSIVINAPVADDLRAAGGDIVLSSSVGGDLVIFGGSVTIPAGAVIEGDAVLATGDLHLGGTVRGDLLVHAGTVDITGTVGGKVRLYATERVSINGSLEGETVFVGPRAALGADARFGKDVTYWREGGELDFGAVPVGGQVRYDTELSKRTVTSTPFPRERQTRKALGGFFFGSLLSGILVIVLSTLLLKGVFRTAGEALHQSYWQSTGIGILALVLLPVAGFLAMITVLGIPVGLLLMVMFAFSLVFGRVITAMAFAAWLERRKVVEWGTGRLMLVSIGLYIAIKLAGLIPFVGWLLVLFAVLAGYGALVLGLSRTRLVS